MTRDLQAALARTLGAPVERWQRLSGGDVNRAFRITTGAGRELFVKHRPDAPPGMYALEAAGLAWLADAGAVRTPAVVAVGDGDPAFLALEWIAPGAPAADYAERLGRGLAALHASGAPCTGHRHDNYIATLPQSNAAAVDWPEFYWSRRLEPLVRRGRDAGLVTERLAGRFAALARVLPDLCGPPEPPARLHGDLWGGNAIVDAAGGPVLVDPAVYGGHREVDLAMMRLFGGFSARVFAAYEEAVPLAPGHAHRVGLYQLWPLLVHVNLFGAGYLGRLEEALDRYVP